MGLEGLLCPGFILLGIIIAVYNYSRNSLAPALTGGGFFFAVGKVFKT